jgi:hypothetical protein
MKHSHVEIIKQKAYSYDAFPGMSAPDSKVRTILDQLCLDLDKPLVVFFDEANLLSGYGLITFLAQIRDGFNERYKLGNKFPSSLALVGMRNIRDYLTSNHPESVDQHLASPFNIVAERLTLANFTQDEVRQLYSQHTEATGQIFDESAIVQAWYWTEGQPWLVNALANVLLADKLKNDYSVLITGEHVDQAAQALILRNDTHFDSLKERLKEPRVRRVIETVMIGAIRFPKGISDDNIKYVLDLGRLKNDLNNSKVLKIANLIYQEVIPGSLNNKIQQEVEIAIPDTYGRQWMDGISLDMTGLLKSFQSYWSENSEMFIKNNMFDSYIINSISDALSEVNMPDNIKLSNEIINNIQDDLINFANEALMHLILYTFLQRVLNGGADFIQREYALGTLRADICISYKGNRYPLELKIKGHKSQDESIKQLLGYMNKSLSEEGWLVVFDKDFAKPWNEKISWETKKYKNKTIHIVSC